MKIFYYESRHGNFGDDLNKWLWPRLIPEIDSQTHAEWLIGIGTILDGRIDALDGRKIVAGAGYRPSHLGKPSMKDTTLVGVRGLLTCEHLGMEKRFACGDPALMIRRFAPEIKKHTGRVAFMPHYQTASSFNTSKIATLAGLDYIDPRWDVDRVLEAILSADRIITEAMHGAIVADALGVPWKRLRIFNHIRENSESVDFKWRDWASVYKIDPTPAASFFFPEPRTGIVGNSIYKALKIKNIMSLVTWLKYQSQQSAFQLSKERDRVSVDESFDYIIESILKISGSSKDV